MKTTHYGKYVFSSIEQAQEKIAPFKEEGEINFHHFEIKGAELITPAEIDIDSELIEEPIYKDNCLVDVIWRGLEPENKEEMEADETVRAVYDHPYGWKSYAVTPENPIFEVNGQSYLKSKL